MRKALIFITAAVIGAFALTVRAQHPAASGHEGHEQRRAAPFGGGHAAAAAQTYEIVVTSDGFVPASLAVKRGDLVRLVVTRKTDQTCAKEIVVQDYGIRRSLPLNKAVVVEFTPDKSGEVRYSCGMDMIAGVLIVK